MAAAQRLNTTLGREADSAQLLSRQLIPPKAMKITESTPSSKASCPCIRAMCTQPVTISLSQPKKKKKKEVICDMQCSV